LRKIDSVLQVNWNHTGCWLLSYSRPYFREIEGIDLLSIVAQVIVITDGEPAGEPIGATQNVIINAKNMLANSQYGSGAIAFQFAQVSTRAPFRLISRGELRAVYFRRISCIHSWYFRPTIKSVGCHTQLSYTFPGNVSPPDEVSNQLTAVPLRSLTTCQDGVWHMYLPVVDYIIRPYVTMDSQI